MSYAAPLQPPQHPKFAPNYFVFFIHGYNHIYYCCFKKSLQRLARNHTVYGKSNLPTRELQCHGQDLAIKFLFNCLIQQCFTCSHVQYYWGLNCHTEIKINLNRNALIFNNFLYMPINIMLMDIELVQEVSLKNHFFSKRMQK